MLHPQPLTQRARAYPELRDSCLRDSRPTLWAIPEAILKCALPVSLWAQNAFLKGLFRS